MMKNVKLQLTDADGNVKEEKELTIEENDTLIMKYPPTMPTKYVQRCFQSIVTSLEEGKKYIGIPESITFEVIKVK